VAPPPDGGNGDQATAAYLAAKPTDAAS